jgi:hypothetical protein
MVSRRMMRIPWTAKITNTDTNKASELKQIIADLRRRQATSVGHVLRKEKLKDIMTTGK